MRHKELIPSSASAVILANHVMKIIIFTFSIFIMALPAKGWAQGEGPDQFFRPVTSNDLVTRLPPRANVDRRFSSDTSNFLDFDGRSGGCPDNVLIGSVDGDADVFGGVDIDVVVNSDIIINCGGLR